MTREEAIPVFKALIENPLFSDEHKNAFNIAIHDIRQRHDWDINNLILINKENYESADCPKFRNQQEKHRVFHTVTAVEKFFSVIGNDDAIDDISILKELVRKMEVEE